MDDSHCNNEIEERVVIKKDLDSRKDKLELRVEKFRKLYNKNLIFVFSITQLVH